MILRVYWATIATLFTLFALLAFTAVHAQSKAPVATSTASKDKGTERRVEIKAQMKITRNVEDARGAYLTTPDTNPALPYHLFQTDFALVAEVVRFDNLRFDLQLGLPVRNVYTSDPARPTGSEVGGFDAGLLTRWGSFLLKTFYSQRASSTLRLHATNTQAHGSLSYVFEETLFGFARLQIEGGPLAAYSLAGEESSAASFGPQVGGFATAMSEFNFGEHLRFRAGLSALYNQILSYSAFGVSEGPAQLLALRPELAYHVLDFLWVSVSYEAPILRPQGREFVFGNPRLMGLHGGTLAFNLSLGT